MFHGHRRVSRLPSQCQGPPTSIVKDDYGKNSDVVSHDHLADSPTTTVGRIYAGGQPLHVEGIASSPPLISRAGCCRVPDRQKSPRSAEDGHLVEARGNLTAVGMLGHGSDIFVDAGVTHNRRRGWGCGPPCSGSSICFKLSACRHSARQTNLCQTC